MKKVIVAVICLAVLFLSLGCENHTHEELSDAEIKAILSDVVASDQAIEEAGLRYFSKLSSENNNIITPQALQERLERGENLFVLDIRREADYKAGHIETAQNIWWFDIGKNLDKLPKDRIILATCYSGQSAGQVVGALTVMGYEALSLAGGMNGGWLAAGLPVVTSE
jgi:rhodanese-related sulfurtransferase